MNTHSYVLLKSLYKKNYDITRFVVSTQNLIFILGGLRNALWKPRNVSAELRNTLWKPRNVFPTSQRFC